MYLTFNEYVQRGGLIQQAEFFRLEFKSRKTVDKLTHKRLVTAEQIPEEVKMLMVELIEIYHEQTKQKVTSISNDGFSIDYLVLTDEQIAQRINTLTTQYLSDVLADDGTPLLNSGV